jgi:hypothetical protein
LDFSISTKGVKISSKHLKLGQIPNLSNDSSENIYIIIVAMTKSAKTIGLILRRVMRNTFQRCNTIKRGLHIARYAGITTPFPLEDDIYLATDNISDEGDMFHAIGRCLRLVCTDGIHTTSSLRLVRSAPALNWDPVISGTWNRFGTCILVLQYKNGEDSPCQLAVAMFSLEEVENDYSVYVVEYATPAAQYLLNNASWLNWRDFEDGWGIKPIGKVDSAYRYNDGIATLETDLSVKNRLLFLKLEFRGEISKDLSHLIDDPSSIDDLSSMESLTIKLGSKT